MARKPVRIAVIFSRFGPYHLARLEAAAREGARRGAEVVGIEVARTDDIYAWDVAEARGAPLATLFPQRAYQDLSAWEIQVELLRTLDHLAPNAVAINGWSVAEARAAIAWTERRARIAVVMSETKADDGPRVWWKELAKGWLAGRCDAALVGGAAHARYLAGLGFPPERIVLGYDAIDNAYFQRESRRVRADADAIRAKAGLPERYFLACTRFVARKNVALLLRAYGRYRAEAEGSPWSLVVAGSGEEAARLRALEAVLKIDGVIWPGFLQYHELPIYYGLASAFVHPALAEPWGLVVNEAAASGLPILASRSVGAAGELVNEGVNGYLFDPRDEGDLADRMLQLAGLSEAVLADMGRASETIVDMWGPERFGTGLLDAVALGKRCKRARRAA